MFTAHEKAKCAEREARQRRRVYPRLIAGRRMSQEEADKQIAMMDEIATDYAKVAERERLL